MSNNLVLPANELEALRSVAADIRRFPPFEEWVEIRRIDPQNATNTQLYWEWLGRSLDAYFCGRSDPLEDSGLNDTLQAVIQDNSNSYIILSVLIFQGEKFLKKEAKTLGKIYPFNNRSDLLKELALEECRYKTLLSLQEHWESHSERQRNERLREYQKHLRGESSAINNTQLKRWDKEDSKLHRDDTLSSKAMPWMHFCMEVFTKYREKLPAYKLFIETLGIPKYGGIKKFAIIDGIFRNYPGRGSNKRSKSS